METKQEPTSGTRHVEAIKTKDGVPMYRVLNSCGLGIGDFATWADATLDASAPDLLAALKALIPMHSAAINGSRAKYQPEVTALFRIALLAIAKAEGK